MRAGDETFEAAARARVAGQIGDDEFLRRTMGTWRAVTARLWRRWRRKLPSDVGPEDVQQALLVLAVEYAGKCRPARLGTCSYGGYIVWCATRRAQRQIHKWRGAHLSGNESRNPGRFERCFSSMGRPDDDRREDYEARLLGEVPDPVEWVERGRRFDAQLAASRTVREALVLIALRRADGSVEAAAAEIWRSYDARLECGATSERHAARIVRGVLAGMRAEPGEDDEDFDPGDEIFELDPEPEEVPAPASAERAA